MTGQPTYKGSEVRFEGIPTCSDGPCTGNDFNYLKKGAVESKNPKACCDRENNNSFYYNPQSGKGYWPGKHREMHGIYWLRANLRYMASSCLFVQGSSLLPEIWMYIDAVGSCCAHRRLWRRYVLQVGRVAHALGAGAS
jgi:hypothetical protein